MGSHETKTKKNKPVLWLLLVAVVCLCALYALDVIGGKTTEYAVGKAYDIGYSSYVYTGEMSDGRFNGEGEVLFSDGSSYKGGFAEGRFEGSGVFTSIDGWRYDGIFSRGRITGDGVFFGADGKEWLSSWPE